MWVPECVVKRTVETGSDNVERRNLVSFVTPEEQFGERAGTDDVKGARKEKKSIKEHAKDIPGIMQRQVSKKQRGKNTVEVTNAQLILRSGSQITWWNRWRTLQCHGS